MSETIKDSEENVEFLDNSAGLQVLEKEAGKFDPEKALRLQERDKPKKQERGAQFLQVMPEKKKEVELSPQDAANEYLSLLDELSKDFSNPYYSDERRGDSHYAGNITTDLGKKYSDNPHYRWEGYVGTEAGEKDGTMLRIASADNILANEIGWREEGEKNAAAIEENREEIAKLDEEYSKKGRLGKFFGKKKYEKAREKLGGLERGTDLRIQRHNEAIAKELAISYNEDGSYDYDRKNQDYGQTQNEARNRRFFGLDDSERAAKVERAIELRKKYVAEWTKKK